MEAAAHGGTRRDKSHAIPNVIPPDLQRVALHHITPARVYQPSASPIRLASFDCLGSQDYSDSHHDAESVCTHLNQCVIFNSAPCAALARTSHQRHKLWPSGPRAIRHFLLSYSLDAVWNPSSLPHVVNSSHLYRAFGRDGTWYPSSMSHCSLLPFSLAITSGKNLPDRSWCLTTGKLLCECLWSCKCDRLVDRKYPFYAEWPETANPPATMDMSQPTQLPFWAWALSRITSLFFSAFLSYRREAVWQPQSNYSKDPSFPNSLIH